jgi:hypothetical protein
VVGYLAPADDVERTALLAPAADEGDTAEALVRFGAWLRAVAAVTEAG